MRAQSKRKGVYYQNSPKMRSVNFPIKENGYVFLTLF